MTRLATKLSLVDPVPPATCPTGTRTPLRIGIDARFLTHPQLGGFKTYTTGLVEALMRVDHENRYYLYVDRPWSANGPLATSENFSVIEVPEVVPMVGMAWREQVSLPAHASRDRLDIFHAPALSAPLRLDCPLVVTIHDMLWRHEERSLMQQAISWRRRAMQAYYRTVPAWAAHKAAAVITVSEASKAAIVEQLGVPPARLVVTLEAAGEHFSRIDDNRVTDAMRRNRGLAGDYILALGSADPRKNLSTLLKAFQVLEPALREQVTLALVMAHPRLEGVLTAQVNALGLANRVKLLNHVDDTELAALYSAATVFAFPSLMEGFGLPLLEAMTCGAPVVAADNSSIPEVVGDAALLFDGVSHESLRAALTRVLSDSSLRASLVLRGTARAREFSWERCARATVACYERTAAALAATA